MATLVFKPYTTYMPTPPRLKSTAARRKPAPGQDSTINKLQHIRSSGASLSTPQLAAAAANDDMGHRPGIRGTGTVYGRSDKENEDDDDDDDDRDLPTIEELLRTKLQEQGFTTEDRGSDKTGRVEEVVLEERGGSVDQSRLVQSENSGGIQEDPIVLLEDNDSSASEAEVNNSGHCAESVALDSLFDSQETAIDSTTSVPPFSSDEWHDIDDFCETEESSGPNCMRPYASSSRPSSEPLHNHIGAAGQCTVRASSETTMSHPARPRNQPLDHLPTDRSAADEHELVRPALDINIFGEERQRQEEQNKDGRQLQQEMKEDSAAALMSGKVGDTHLSSKMDESPRLAGPGPSPEPSQDKLVSYSHSCSGDELNNKPESDKDDGRPCPDKRKRKRPSSPNNGLTQKKRMRYPEQRSTRQHRPRSKPYRRSLKSPSLLDQGLRVAAVFSAESRLPPPALSALQTMDIEMLSDYSNLSESSSDILPTLTEVTFRPHSPQCCSFTAVIRDGCYGRGVSFSQVARFIESIGHVGKIDDFTIKPMEQHSFLLTGFSRYTSSQPSSGGGTLSTVEAGRIHRKTTRTRPQDGRVIDAGALASRSEPLSNDDDGGLSDSDPDLSSDDDGCSSEAEKQGRSSKSKHSRWSDLQEQRLLAYKTEDKSWDWIFKRFPGRTPAAVRTRWNMVRPRDD